MVAWPAANRDQAAGLSCKARPEKLSKTTSFNQCFNFKKNIATLGFRANQIADHISMCNDHLAPNSPIFHQWEGQASTLLSGPPRGRQRCVLKAPSARDISPTSASDKMFGPWLSEKDVDFCSPWFGDPKNKTKTRASAGSSRKTSGAGLGTSWNKHLEKWCFYIFLKICVTSQNSQINNKDKSTTTHKLLVLWYATVQPCLMFKQHQRTKGTPSASKDDSFKATWRVLFHVLPWQLLRVWW